MSQIFKCLKRREWAYVVISLCLIVVQVWLDLKLPEYMSEITVLVQTEGSVMADILAAGGMMLACAIGALVLTVIVGFFSARIATTISMRLREKVYQKTISFAMADMNRFSTGSLITRTTNDITQVQTLISIGYIALFRAPLMAVYGIIKILDKNLTFSAVVFVGVLSLLVVMSIVLTLAIPKSKKIQILTDKLNILVREHLTGVRVVRAYNAEQYQEDKFEVANEEVAAANIFVNRTTALIGPYMTFLMSSLTLIIYWAGAALINQAGGMDKLQIFSDMVVFMSYAMQIIMAFMMLTMMSMQLPRVIVALGRIGEVIDCKNEILDGAVSQPAPSPVAVEFKNVTFAYPDGEEAVLENVSFRIEKGQTAAFIGSTGSGKSTIVNLLLRFYDCTKGEILVDGVNVKDYTQHALREKLGLVSQKAILFSGTVASNIAYGQDGAPDATSLQKAVEVAQAEDFVDKIGVDGSVSQGGINLSGGQKQRLSIARAIYKNPDIYILDDCFSALDYRTDKLLRAALTERTAGATKLMVAQRISTVKDAHQIIVLDSGTVAGIGTHRALLNTCEVYQEIAHSQLSKEELDHA